RTAVRSGPLTASLARPAALDVPRRAMSPELVSCCRGPEVIAVQKLTTLLWAHEDLRLGPLPCQGIHELGSAQSGELFARHMRYFLLALTVTAPPRGCPDQSAEPRSRH